VHLSFVNSRVDVSFLTHLSIKNFYEHPPLVVDGCLPVLRRTDPSRHVHRVEQLQLDRPAVQTRAPDLRVGGGGGGAGVIRQYMIRNTEGAVSRGASGDA
jgi:hypothetical protein